MNGPTVTLERELKLGADLGFVMPDLGDLIERTTRLPDQTLRTTYFDTSDLDLWQRSITLRHRLGEEPGHGVWTLKVPEKRAGSGSSLDRTELTWSGTVGEVPNGALALIKGIVRRKPLHSLAELETTRRRLTLHADGAVLGELDDDTVTIHGGPHDGLRFRQIELETDKPDDPLIAVVTDRLRNAGARPGEGVPKLARALDVPARGEERPATSQLGRRATIGAVARMSLTGTLDRVLDHEYRVRLDPRDPSPHDIHQMRVATRRLRSDLKTLGRVLDPIWVRHTREELKWLDSALGKVRDADVLAEYIDGRGARSVDPEGKALLAAILRAERTSACGSLSDALSSDRYLLLLDRIHAATVRPPFWPAVVHGSPTEEIHPDDLAREVLPKLVQRPWKKLRKKVRHAGSSPTDRQLHRVRIQAKQLRYGAESAEGIFGKAARRTAVAAENLQNVLGEHHDAVVADAWLRRQVDDRRLAIISFAAGQLSADQDRRMGGARREWTSAWRELDRKKRRRWLTT